MAALFRLRLLTAQRGGEIHGATWQEIDLDRGWWTIPKERRKGWRYSARCGECR